MKMINQKSWYNRSLIEQQIGISNLQEREQLLKEKKKGTATTIPLLLKYDRTFLNIKEIVMKHWHLLQYKPKSNSNISKSTYFSLLSKQKLQRHYW